MQLKLYWMILMLLLINLANQTVDGKEIDMMSIGLRAGMNDNRNDEDFKQYEVLSTWNLPWTRQWDTGLTLSTYLEANAGVLRGGGKSAFVGSIGPGIHITGFKKKLTISMGINPTIIGKYKFGDEDLGGPIEFTSHIGLNLNFARHYTIGYRLQHMSNAFLYDTNPGVNSHMIEIVYRF